MCYSYAHDKAKPINSYDYPPVYVSTCNDFFSPVLAVNNIRCVFVVSFTSLSIREVDIFGAINLSQGRCRT
jgi:hypothetical protein